MSRRPALSLDLQCRAMRFPEPVTEHYFAKSIGRRWRFDYAWPDRMLAVEIEGITYTRGNHQAGGRHTSITGFKADIEKYGVAFSMGWRVLRVMPGDIKSGRALDWLEPILTAAAPGVEPPPQVGGTTSPSEPLPSARARLSWPRD